MIAAPIGLTNAHGAVIATSPASIPLHNSVVSDFIPLAQSVSMAKNAPVKLASIVLTTTKLIRRSVPARVDPGLNPNHPKARMKVPSATIGTLWPGIACGLPCASYLPMRGPIIIAPASAIMPPIEWTTPEPAKSTAPCPRPQLIPPCANQPPPQTQFAYKQ